MADDEQIPQDNDQEPTEPTESAEANADGQQPSGVGDVDDAGEPTPPTDGGVDDGVGGDGDDAATAALAAAQAAISQINTEADSATGAAGSGSDAVDDSGAEQLDVDALTAQAAAEAGMQPSTAAGDTAEAQAFDLPSFGPAASDREPEPIDLLNDVNLNVKIELGRTRMLVEDVLRLADGSVVELDKLAGDPVDIYVNERHVARGEVLVLNDNFCVRVNEILNGPLTQKGG